MPVLDQLLAVLIYLVIAVLAGVTGAGFALIIRTSPLGAIDKKPFACRTCLSGWGAIAAVFFLLPVPPPMPIGVFAAPADPAISLAILWCLLSFAGIGVAALIHATYPDPRAKPASLAGLFGEVVPVAPPPLPGTESGEVLADDRATFPDV